MDLKKIKFKTGTAAIYVLALMLVGLGYWNYVSTESNNIQTVAETQTENSEDENQEQVDPRDLLVDKLVEYKRFQQCAQQLNELLQKRNKLASRKESNLILKTTRLQDCQVEKLFSSLQNLLDFTKQTEIVRYIDVAELSIKDAIRTLVKKLKESKTALAFSELLVTEGREQIVVYFLAVLELLKQNKLVVIQEDIFAPILICLKEDARC